MKKISNCLIEALKAKIRQPKKVTIYCVHSLRARKKKRLHFMWSDGENDFEFVPLSRFYFPLIFRGQIKVHSLGTIEKFKKLCAKKKLEED